MSARDRIENAVHERRVKSRVYDILMSDQDIDRINELDQAQAPNLCETLQFRLLKMAGVVDAKVGVLGIYITVNIARDTAEFWYMIEQTITNYLEEEQP